MTNQTATCYHCKEKVMKLEAVKEDITKPEAKRKSFRYIHKNCYEKYQESQKETEEKMKDWKDWDELYQYVKYEIFHYEKKMSLSRQVVGRLQGLRSGNYGFKRNQKVLLSDEGYPYKVILLTFKIKKVDIINAISDRSKFKSKEDGWNYAMAIVSNNINNVYLRLREREESNRRVEEVKLENHDVHTEFKNKTKIHKNKVANKLSHLF
ncbi:hypothetical protein BEH_07850 [Priestia filamentosa]|uniref:Uncharacterized protein n=1 Tax=Priestia filamentosa TaxID=1402861 RepID=A0A0H4KD24_9BACI|nr:hypothetical protein [Priestia filamentosa]AKO92022.1 hypothetical protein BEH_07850 [Priestia filamentosa]